jgi:hypothetical protein
MTAFRATYSDFKLVKTRKVVQIVLEVPVEQANNVLDVLGGMPDPSRETWVGVAPLHPDATQPQPKASPAAGAKRGVRPWVEIAPPTQAGIRCDDPVFVSFLKEERADDWHEAQDAAECVRMICGVQSRSELATNHKARVMWKQLDDQFQAWKAVEHA